MYYKNEWRFIKREIPKEVSSFIDAVFEIYEIRKEVHRKNGIKFIIHTNETNHTIPHVHIEYAEWSASIRIEDGKVFAGNLPRKQHKYAEKWVLENKENLLNAWKKITIDAYSVMTKSRLDVED